MITEIKGNYTINCSYADGKSDDENQDERENIEIIHGNLNILSFGSEIHFPNLRKVYGVIFISGTCKVFFDKLRFVKKTITLENQVIMSAPNLKTVTQLVVNDNAVLIADNLNSIKVSLYVNFLSKNPLPNLKFIRTLYYKRNAILYCHPNIEILMVRLNYTGITLDISNVITIKTIRDFNKKYFHESISY